MFLTMTIAATTGVSHNERDALAMILLADEFSAECGSQLGIGLGQRGAEEPVKAGDGTLFVHGDDH